MNAYANPQFDIMSLPPQRECTQRHARATAAVVGGLIDPNPEWRGPRFANTIHMPTADLLVTATFCARPLLLPEMRSSARNAGLDGLITRDRQGSVPTFDIYLGATDEWMLCYHLWLAAPDERWLVPTAGPAKSVRISPFGLALSSALPFADSETKARGFDLADHAYRSMLRRA